jgi:hypothetical protein
MNRFIEKRWMKKILLISTFLLYFLIFPKETLAMSFEISNISPTLVNSTTQEIQISLVNINISTGSYLRASFQKNDGDPYFGEMSQDKNNWTLIRSITSGDCSGYYFVNSGVNSVDLYLRIGNNNPQTGDYKVKINRFTAGCSFDNNTKMEGNVTISLPISTPSPTPFPTASPSPNPTQSSLKAIYKIDKSKDGSGAELSSVQIYVDGQYIHHEDDEILEFYTGHDCYTGISCDFGNHIISLRKDGYSNWENTKDFIAGMNLEVVPILIKQATPTSSSSSSPIPSSIKTSTPISTRSPISTKTPIPIPTNSPLEEVLGVETIFSTQTPLETQSPSKNNGKSFPFFAIGLIALGLGFVGFSIYTMTSSLRNSAKPPLK